METVWTYRKARGYLESRPRTKLASKNALTLERIHSVLAEIDNPQNQFGSIHIAGTSGKGSVVAIVSSILAQAGHKTGSFYSPYLESPRESIQINGRIISQQAFANLVSKYHLTIKRHNLSHFETKTLLAFAYFAQQKVDFSVIETGLGGRLDATNLVKPSVAVITTIDFDHTEVLGKTLEKIAKEKAGIIKSKVPVVTAAASQEALKVIQQVAIEKNSVLYAVKRRKIFHKTNETLARKVIEVLRAQGVKIPKKSEELGIKKAFIPGRFELVGDIILDGAHNPEKMRAFAARFRRTFPEQKAVAVFGALATKDHKTMLKILRPIARIVVNTRLKNSEHKFTKAQFSDERKALKYAKLLKKPGEKLIITGSLYLVGALRNVVLQRPKIS